MITFQNFISQLNLFWEKQGCIIQQGYDLEVGAGTFNPATFLRCLGPEPYKGAYVEPSRRPTDGRYGNNPNRLQHFFQYQVALKPSPPDIQNLYLQSLQALGFNLKNHDIRFVHDDWESPTLGAWGLGWEVWMDGMEITQFTYFQSVGGIPLKPITGELTYGIERLAMYLQGVDNIFDLQWNEDLTYGDIYHQNEVQWSKYNFEESCVDMWWQHFNDFENEAKRLIDKNLPLPAYDFVMKASHAFNVLDARGVISVTERTGYIARIRNLSCKIAENYILNREALDFPLLKKYQTNTNENSQPQPQDHQETFDPNKRNDFVLEIGSEELPASFVPIGCMSLEKTIRTFLDQACISYENIQVHGTPRRLTAYISALAEGTPTKTQERKGPPLSIAFDTEGEPTKAGRGFFRSIHSDVATLKEIKANKYPHIFIKSLKNVDYLFASLTTQGKASISFLSELLPKLILSIDFPKTMRWGDRDISYARPLRWILALYGKQVVPFSIGDIFSGNTSYGHPQLMAKTFTVKQAQDYFSSLLEHKVMVNITERLSCINEQIDKIEKETGNLIIEKDRVIPQVLHLVEWPMLTVATFSKSFLNAPKEVLVSEMVEHQKYFPITDTNNCLMNDFVITANNTPSDEIRKGNIKVISARLADGVFLYEQDLKTTLEAFNEKLKHITFQKELGSIYEKVLRIVENATIIHSYIPGTHLQKLQRAALFCKSDLASELVGEFPDLQGVVGKLYANAQGEDFEIAQAIDEHWMPRGENSPLPQSLYGTILSLSEKIDNFLSCFSIGLKPTSSSDPYALRRQAFGIIKMLIQGKHRLPLNEILQKCYACFRENLSQKEKSLPLEDELIEEIKAFFANRIKTVFQDDGLKKDEIEASLTCGFHDIYDTFCRAQALHNFRLSNKKFPLMYEVYRRAKGQLNHQKNTTFSEDLLKEKEENALHKKLVETEEELHRAIQDYRYDDAYEYIAKLHPYLVALFDNVRILSDEKALQFNRIALLQRVFSLFEKLLDFGKLQEKVQSKHATSNSS